MKRLLVLIIFFSCGWHSLAAAPDELTQTLSNSPQELQDLQQTLLNFRSPPPAGLRPLAGHRFRVDLFTIEPGAAPYSVWGHTALRIYDAAHDRDLVFDFGRFQFDDRFFERFLRNQPQYELGVDPLLRTFLFYQRYENRRIYAQQLLLSDAEAQALLLKLLTNYRPENRVYRYNHYTDNCTTRIRDLIDGLLDGRLKARFGPEATEHSFRSSGAEKTLSWPVKSLSPFYWLAVNLIQGALVDDPITVWQRLFLPEELMQRLDQLRTEEHLESRVGPIQLALPSASLPLDQSVRLAPWLTWGALYGLLLALCFAWPAWQIKRRGAVVFGALTRKAHHMGAGLLGALLLFLWLGADHESMDNNWNVLCYPPFLWLIPFLEFFWRSPRWNVWKLKLNFYLTFPPALAAICALTGLAPRSALAFALPALGIQYLIFLRYRRLLSAAEA
ncbi:MAG: DUF4105 domain-containing protein [Leptospirales bacterium]|nr:DUF4105 domain-containing protein [Leptospirales bacterium]